MHYLVTMAIKNGPQNLSQDFCCFFFSEVFGFDDLVKKLSPRAKLSDDIEIPFILVKLEDFDDVGMVLTKNS